MKITKLQVRNMYGLRFFDWQGKDIELTGQKGVGKSSLVHAIKYALTNKSDREYIITQGAKEGEVLIETDTGLRINRKVRTEKADYKSIRQGNEKDEKTESFLREIFTELQLNPVEFAAMSENEQNRIILDLIDFKWDMNWIVEQFGEIPPQVDYEQNILCVLHDIQSESGYYFQKRQEYNREARNKQAFVTEIGAALPEGYNAEQWKNVELGAIYKQIETIRNNNGWIEKAKQCVANKDNKIRGCRAELDISKMAIDKETAMTRTSLEKQIAEMENRIKAMQKELETLEEKKITKIELANKTYLASVANIEGEVKQYDELAEQEPVDFSDLQAKADTAEKMKAFVNEYNRMVSLQNEIGDLAKKSETLTAKIEKARTLPGEILQNANIPVEGLEIVDGVPLINGRPVSNLSDGEKLALCVEVAVQREGSLKLLLIDGTEKLDTASRNKMYKTLKQKGVQLIATRTTDQDTLIVTEL